MSWVNALFPEEGWWGRAKAAYTGQGASPNQLLGPAPGDMQFLSDADGQSFVPMEQAQRAARAKRVKQQGEDLLGFVGGLRAYHGSPHFFNKFSLRHIGKGEGAQVYGHGMYFAEKPEIAAYYREALNGRASKAEVAFARKLWEEAGGDYKRALDLLSDGGNTWARDPVRHLILQARREGKIPEQLGHMYEVDIKTEPNRLLDWDKPFPQQSPYVQERTGDFVLGRVNEINAARLKAREEIDRKIARGEELTLRDKALLVDATPETFTGQKIYQMQEGNLGAMRPGQKGSETAEYFRSRGIPGIQYLDQGSRTAGHGTRNYVIFDDNLIDILRRYGTLGPVGAGMVNQLMERPDDTR